MENTTFTKEDVIAASTILTKPNVDNKELKKAEKYLIAFQKSPQSWTISCEILALENLSLEVYAQVAIFLKQKFQYDFYQLPQEEYSNIAQLLIRFLVTFFKSAITSQLSSALVLLYMHAYENLGDIIDMLGQTLFRTDKKEGLGLEIVKMVPEVIYDKQVIIAKKQKDQYVDYIEDHLAEKVFKILDELGKNQNLEPAIKYKILDAFQEWFYFARRSKPLIEHIHEHSCFALALNSMNSSFLSEKARSSINIIIKAVKNPESHPNIFEAIFRAIFEYMKECTEAIKDDVEHVLEYVKVFRAFGIKFAKTMIVRPNEDLMRFLQYIIELTANQKLFIDVLEELEEFWEEFVNEFVSILKTKQYNSKIEEFSEVFKLLIQITVNRIQMNQEQLEYLESRAQRQIDDDQVDDDEEEDTVDQDLRDIEEKQLERRLCKNILLDVQDILGFNETFSHLCGTLRDLVTKLTENNVNWNELNWDMISKFECIMYAAKSTINAAKLKERPDLTEFFQIIMAINLKSVKANRTKIELIEYASERITVNEEMMSTMFKYLAEQLLNPSTSEDAGTALISLCENWSGFVIKNFESFLQLRDQTKENDDLIIALAVAIAYDEQTASREQLLAQLCLPFAERIVKDIEAWDVDPSENITNQVKRNLRKFTMIFGKMPIVDKDDSLMNVHPLEPVLHELWPIFKNAFRKFSMQTRVLVHLCNVIKKCMRVLGVRFKNYLLEYFEIICEIFLQNPISDFLYAIEVSATVFGKMPDMLQPLTKVYEFVSSATLTYIDGKDMRDYDDLLEDFFGMLFRYLKYLPQVILCSNTLEVNLHLAELAIGVDQPNIEKTLFLFLEVLFQTCSYNPQNEIEQAITEIVVNKYGAIYINKLVVEFTSYPQERLRDYIRDIIFGSFIKLKNHTLQWLENALGTVSETILSQKEKQEMLQSLEKIDITKHEKKNENEDSDSDDEPTEVFSKFKDLFEFFEYRCKLIDRRNYRFERAIA